MHAAASRRSGASGTSAIRAGQYAEARKQANVCSKLRGTANDSGQLLEAHHALWATFAIGQRRATAAIEHMESGIALYDRKRHAGQRSSMAATTPAPAAATSSALDLWLIGQPDRALASVRDALRLAGQLQHPLTEVITLWFASWIHYQRGDRPATVEAADRLQSLARGARLHAVDGRRDRPAAGRARRRPWIARRWPRCTRGIVAGRSATWRHLLCVCVLSELYLRRRACPRRACERLAAISEKTIAT